MDSIGSLLESPVAAGIFSTRHVLVDETLQYSTDRRWDDPRSLRAKSRAGSSLPKRRYKEHHHGPELDL